MTLLTTTAPDAIGAAFARLVAIARRGLPRLVTADGRALCHRALQRPGGQVALEGRSERYTAMALIGIGHWQQHDPGAAPPLPLDELYAGLAAWPSPSAGDQGLILWAQLLRGDARATATAQALLQRREQVFDARSDFASMEMGFLLRGLAAGRAAGLPGMAEFADEVAAMLLRNQDQHTGLFSFSRRVRRKNLFRTRRETHLGSFASQVYPTMALAALTAAGGDPCWLRAAERCAERIASLQGPTGQWWWIYQCRRATPAVRYPVYTVHQDAMGPMLLLSTALASGQPRRFDTAIERSLQWFDHRDERPDAELLDDAGGMVWRAVQRDDPATTAALGLGSGELLRLGRVAWTGTEDRRGFHGGHVCPESRPYHHGWILLAAAMWAQSRVT